MRSKIFLAILLLIILSVSTAIYADTPEEAEKIYQEGQALYDRGLYQEALEKSEEGLKLARKLNDNKWLFVFLFSTGYIYLNELENYEKALPPLLEALPLCAKLNRQVIEAETLDMIARTYVKLGKGQQALAYYRQLREILQEIGNRDGESECFNNIGVIHLSLGDYKKGQENFEKALALYEELGNKQGGANALNNLGLIYTNRGNYLEGLDYFEKSMKIFQELEDSSGLANSYNNLGMIYNYTGDYQRALEYYEESLKKRQEIGDKTGEGDSLNNIGMVKPFSRLRIL